MIKLLLKYKWHLASIVLLMIAEPSITAVLNFWLQKIFNSAVPGAEKLTVIRYLTAGFLLWILKRLVAFTSSVIKDRYICNAKQDVKHSMFTKLFGLDTANISATASSGEYISNFTNDITLLEQRFFNQIISLFSGFFSIAILGSSFFALNTKLAASIIAFGVVTMFVPLAFSKALNEKNLAYSNRISVFTQKLKEYIVAYPTIKNYSIERKIAERFNLHNQAAEDAKFEADYTISLANNVGIMLAWFMQFIGVGLGIMLVVKGEILIGTVVAAQAFASDLAMPLQGIIVNFNSIRSVSEIVHKLESLSDNTGTTAPEALLSDAEQTALLQEETCEICFDDLSLCLGDNTVIDHFSYTFEPGKKYLIVGLNGSGKSSVFKALKKWFANCTGHIRINGSDLAGIPGETLSRLVSYLNENVTLFSGSVRDNVALYRGCDDAQFSQAVTEAHMELDPNREITDEGRNISSGEQRRIEIARSLLSRAKVLIFDEVVSTLDIETAYEIEKQALAFDNKTVIFISHNFSGKLIGEYDEILVMDHGRLIAHGKYESLLQTCDYFRRICSIKFGT